MEERAATSWLCPDEADRERLLDMEPRLHRVRALTMGVLALVLVVLIPWFGAWTLVPLAVAALGFRLGEHLLPRVSKPEYVLGGMWLLSQAMIGLSVAFTGGAHSPAVPWLAIPVVTLSARFTARGVAAGVGATVAVMVAVTVGLEPLAVWERPYLLLGPLALLVAVAVLSTALMRSDLHHRSQSVIDPLTGLLNRKALATRLEELREQAAISGDSVGLVVGDIDHFKRVNDNHGHGIGDAVLSHVAYSLRKHLRAFDLVYRLGGEEFLVILPGSGSEEAAEVAEALRRAIEATTHGALAVTMSFGVAASEGGAFDRDEVMCRADAALYKAKEEGRNRVCVSGASAASAAGRSAPREGGPRLAGAASPRRAAAPAAGRTPA